MFWFWFIWQVEAPPISLREDKDTYRLNDLSILFWRSMPKGYLAYSILMEIL
jgi:hypothetical protein